MPIWIGHQDASDIETCGTVGILEALTATKSSTPESSQEVKRTKEEFFTINSDLPENPPLIAT